MRTLPETRLAALLLMLLAAGLRAAEDDGGGVRIRPVWWRSPTAALQLYAEDGDGKPRAVRVLQMCPLDAFTTTPAKGAVLQRRIEPDPADPKSRERWEPYASAAIPKGAHDLLMLLVPSEDGKGCQARLLAMDEERLPWGSTLLVNFSAVRLHGLIDGKPFDVPPGAAVPLPFVARRRSVVDVILADSRPSGQNIVFSAKGIFTPAKRSLLFILRKADDSGYETRAIEEPNPDPKAHEDSEPGR